MARGTTLLKREIFVVNEALPAHRAFGRVTAQKFVKQFILVGILIRAHLLPGQRCLLGWQTLWRLWCCSVVCLAGLVGQGIERINKGVDQILSKISGKIQKEEPRTRRAAVKTHFRCLAVFTIRPVSSSCTRSRMKGQSVSYVAPSSWSPCS